MKKFYLLLSLIVTACAGSQVWLKNMDVSGFLSIEPSDKYGSDYRVEFKGSVMDIGYNSNDRSDRIRVLKSYASSACPNGYKIQKEDTLKIGHESNVGNGMNYFIYIKCK